MEQEYFSLNNTRIHLEKQCATHLRLVSTRAEVQATQADAKQKHCIGNKLNRQMHADAVQATQADAVRCC